MDRRTAPAKETVNWDNAPVQGVEPPREEPADVYQTYEKTPYEAPQTEKRQRVLNVLRRVFGWLGTAAVLVLMLGARFSGDIASAICLLLAALMLLPVGALDRLRRRILPLTWLRGMIIALLIILSLCLAII